MCILKLENLAYSYKGSAGKVFEHLYFEFEEGKVYAVLGESGEGKTTLLSLLAGFETPTEGSVSFQKRDLRKINPYIYRSHYVGTVFRSYSLLPQLTALENVLLSMDLAKVSGKDNREKARKLLNWVGINEEKMEYRTSKLSQGQRQRAAIARALSYDPEILLADEPAENIDCETQEAIMKIFHQLAQKGKCIIIATHSEEIALQADGVKKLPIVG